MFTQRAIRRLDSSRSISDAQIELMLNAASKAPNGGNTQPGRFLVIRDRALIKGFGKLYHQAWWAKRRDEMGWTGWGDIPADSVYRLAAKFADEAGDAPLVILAFSVNCGAANSIFPGVQNLLLAARILITLTLVAFWSNHTLEALGVGCPVRVMTMVGILLVIILLRI